MYSHEKNGHLTRGKINNKSMDLKKKQMSYSYFQFSIKIIDVFWTD